MGKEGVKWWGKISVASSPRHHPWPSTQTQVLPQAAAVENGRAVQRRRCAAAVLLRLPLPERAAAKRGCRRTKPYSMGRGLAGPRPPIPHSGKSTGKLNGAFDAPPLPRSSTRNKEKVSMPRVGASPQVLQHPSGSSLRLHGAGPQVPPGLCHQNDRDAPGRSAPAFRRQGLRMVLSIIHPASSSGRPGPPSPWPAASPAVTHQSILLSAGGHRRLLHGPRELPGSEQRKNGIDVWLPPFLLVRF